MGSTTDRGRSTPRTRASATIVWFRQDLRLQDNLALAAALRRGKPVVCAYIFDDEAELRWRAGAATRWWLHRSLERLGASLRDRQATLVLRRGSSEAELRKLIDESGADAVYWNRRYEPSAIARDTQLKAKLTGAGVEVQCFNAALLFEPDAVKNKAGAPFQVFTPFWRHCLTLPVAPPVRVPAGPIAGRQIHARNVNLTELELLPSNAWYKRMEAEWEPGEAGAAKRLREFVSSRIGDYGNARERPAENGTSRLSPHLHFGEIGPRQVWRAVEALSRGSGVFPVAAGAQVFLKELGWREFAHHLLVHFPRTPEEPLRKEFRRFPWRNAPSDLRAWQGGSTGYPIVDAGMRELWATGWMHNRVRMIVASFLVKHLRLPWRAGAEWFWDTLVDADLANNTLGWQWSAGSGADAAPYFRIFNPVLQGLKFDSDGSYVRRWVPEIAALQGSLVHRPWDATETELASAGVRLGQSYPRPIVDHREARDAALGAFRQMRRLDQDVRGPTTKMQE